VRHRAQAISGGAGGMGVLHPGPCASFDAPIGTGRGRDDVAERVRVGGAGRHASAGGPLEAHVRHRLGEAEALLFQREAACQQLETALRLYAEMDMRIWPDQAMTALRALGCCGEPSSSSERVAFTRNRPRPIFPTVLHLSSRSVVYERRFGTNLRVKEDEANRLEVNAPAHL
jgi:hypothetical protein